MSPYTFEQFKEEQIQERLKYLNSELHIKPEDLKKLPITKEELDSKLTALPKHLEQEMKGKVFSWDEYMGIVSKFLGLEYGKTDYPFWNYIGSMAGLFVEDCVLSSSSHTRFVKLSKDVYSPIRK